jgi:hypothetical protein
VSRVQALTVEGLPRDQPAMLPVRDNEVDLDGRRDRTIYYHVTFR